MYHELVDPRAPEGREVAREVLAVVAREEVHGTLDRPRAPAGHRGVRDGFRIALRRPFVSFSTTAGAEPAGERSCAVHELGPRVRPRIADQPTHVMRRSACRRSKEDDRGPVARVVEDVHEAGELDRLARAPERLRRLERHQPAEGVSEDGVRPLRLLLAHERDRIPGEALDRRNGGVGVRVEELDPDDAASGLEGFRQGGELPCVGTGAREDEDRRARAGAELDAPHECDFSMRVVIRRAANSSPCMKRIRGPNVMAPASPAK